MKNEHKSGNKKHQTNRLQERADFGKANRKREVYEDAKAFEDFNDFVKATGWKKSGNQRSNNTVKKSVNQGSNTSSNGKKSTTGYSKKSPTFSGQKSTAGYSKKSPMFSGQKNVAAYAEKKASPGLKNRPTNGNQEVAAASKSRSACSYQHSCGGCRILHDSYDKHLAEKQKEVDKLLTKYCKVEPIIGMKKPDHYRHKVHVVFDHDRKGNPISGVYEEGTHRVVPVDRCLIHNEKADAIIATIRGMLKSFKILTYDEDSGYGLLRHVLIRSGYHSGEIMVVLVLASPIMPSKNNFVKALRKEHPEITTVVVNVNDKQTSMVLGDKEQVIYGKGFIEDNLCGKTFRISPKSFYQVNPAQTEILYNKAIEFAELTGEEIVIDAYSGIGTIGLIASDHAKKVIGVELNKDAIKDANVNAKRNEAANIEFYNNDAGVFMSQMAAKGETADVVFMDPPRTGSNPQFMDAVAVLKPKKVVYVSCNPVTLERDLEYLAKKGYKAQRAIPVDMFPWTNHCEIICLLQKK